MNSYYIFFIFEMVYFAQQMIMNYFFRNYGVEKESVKADSPTI